MVGSLFQSPLAAPPPPPSHSPRPPSCPNNMKTSELRDEARAAVLAHLRHEMDTQAVKGLAFILKVPNIHTNTCVHNSSSEGT